MTFVEYFKLVILTHFVLVLILFLLLENAEELQDGLPFGDMVYKIALVLTLCILAEVIAISLSYSVIKKKIQIWLIRAKIRRLLKKYKHDKEAEKLLEIILTATK
jgi:type III secretory pathway component EscR